MKILQIIPYFYPAQSVGGSAAEVYNFSKLLAKRGHEVTVFTTDLYDRNKRIPGVDEKIKEIDGIKICYFQNLSNHLAYYQHIFFPINFFKAVTENIKNYDLIHLHEIYTPLHLWTAFIALKNKIPYIVSAHGTAMMVKEEGRVWQKKLFYLVGGRKMLENASYLIALNDQERQSYKKFGISEEKIRIIPNGVSASEFKDFPPPSVFRKKYAIEKNTQILLFLGRIHPKKGIEIIIEAINKIKDSNRKFVLVIVGPVENKAYDLRLKKLIKENQLEEKVIFCGSLIGEEKKEALSTADIFVLSSYSEGLPVTPLEAAAAGLPLVISESCGIPQVEQYQAGKLVRTNTDSVVSAVQEITQKKDYKKIYGNNARKMAEDEFLIEDQVDKLGKLYEKIIKK